MADRPNLERIKQNRDAIFGHFGYEVFSERIIVPFVYRSDERWFSMTMLQWHLTLDAPKCTTLQEIGYLEKEITAATSTEIKLLDEINYVHNDGIYPKVSFIEKLLKYEDAVQIIKFQIDCVKAQKVFGLECGGFVRFSLKNIDNKKYILPYYIKNGRDLTPMELVKSVTKSERAWPIHELRKIEVLYMQFLVSLYKCELKNIGHQPTLMCVPVDDLKEYCSRVARYWPKTMDSVENTVVPIGTAIATSTNNNNNNKRKHDADSSSDDDEELEEGIYVVEKIMQCRTKNGGEVLVRWRGYSSDEDTWEPLQNLSEDLREKAEKMMNKKRK